VTYPDLIGLFIEPLEALGLRYFVTGGVASVIYGDPRFTRDVDVVLALDAPDIVRLRSSFDPADFYIPPAEMLEEEVARPTGGHFNLIHARSALRADAYITAGDPLEAWAFENRQRMSVGGRDIWVAPVVYVVTRKLEYYVASSSDRHLRDVAVMLRVSEDAIDRAELGRWLSSGELREALRAAEDMEI
jgi:hypothetical protein